MEHTVGSDRTNAHTQDKNSVVTRRPLRTEKLNKEITQEEREKENEIMMHARATSAIPTIQNQPKEGSPQKERPAEMTSSK